jgi:hypothetical protein
MEPEETQDQQIETLKGQVADLTGKLRKANHFATFKEIASEQGVRPKAVKALYGLVNYDPGDADEADPDAVVELIKGAKSEHDYCFEAEAESVVEETPPKKGAKPVPSPAPAPKPTGLGSGRRASAPAKDTFRVTTADTRNPAWLVKNHAAYAKASQDGTLEIID